MSEFELIEILRSGNDGIDTNFQFWISSSFALLMAFFFAHGKFVSYVKWTAISLYIAASILFFFRLIGNGMMVVQARTALQEMSSDFILYGPGAGNNIGILFMSIMGIGTLATLYFCVNSEKFLGE